MPKFRRSHGSGQRKATDYLFSFAGFAEKSAKFRSRSSPRLKTHNSQLKTQNSFLSQLNFSLSNTIILNKEFFFRFYMEKSSIFEVYEEKKGKNRFIYTKSLAPGTRVYDENIKRKGATEYREWNPYKSKLGASIHKGAPNIFIRSGHIVLYLGASTGTTASHVSDIVGENGFVFALDSAPRVTRDLVFVCEERSNMAPLLEDAFHPENYKDKILPVDIVFQDIAQRNQLDIFLKNVNMFLKPGGYCILAVKSRSVDVTKKPKEIFGDVREKLEKTVKIVDSRNLSPYQKDHMIFFCKK